MQFAAGQKWACKAVHDGGDCRIHIGAIVEFGGGLRIACCAVTDAVDREPDGREREVAIPFLPMRLEALAASVVELDGAAELPEAFTAALAAWGQDPRGVSYYTVPFEGSLDRLIAHQMTAIVEQS
ncbi:MAG: hypothetical protein JSS20_05140 [Proteobacteria bacterium]|nr:hypothetical protein [Pseudomonadota bacterium]